jgi:hypothetical protein
MMLMGLTFFHSMLIMTNRTTLDSMKGNDVGNPFGESYSPERD